MSFGDELWQRIGQGAVLVVVGVLLLLVAWQLAGKWLTIAFERVVALLFGQLIATRAARRFALNRYRKRLVSKYEQLENPFIPEGETLKVSDVYVPLQALEGVDDRATNRTTGRGVPADAYQLIRREGQRAVVTGPPGAGKTLLLRHAMLTWAQADPKRTSRQPIPVLCELRRFSHSELGVEAQIAAQLERDGFGRAGRFVERALRRGDLSLFLDGLDEVASDERDRVAGLIRDFAEHANHQGVQIVVTCRTAVYAGHLEPQFAAKFRLGEFGDQLILRFLRRWPRLQGRPEDAERLWAALRETRRLLALARNPLLLSMIAFLYGESEDGRHTRTLPHSRAEFYKEVCLELLERRKRELSLNRYKYTVKKRVLQRLALAAMEQCGTAADRFELPDRMVRETMAEALPALNLNAEDADPMLTEIVERSGLLRPLDEGERYYFPHLTLQEYLAAEKLAEDPDGLLIRWRADPSRWRETVRLWCGSTPRSATPVVREIHQVDPLLAFQCLTDAGELDRALVDEIVADMSSRLGSASGSELDEIVAAYGQVASDRGPRGAAVFATLAELVRGEGDARDAALLALGATNLPDAVELLAGMTDDKAARAALVRMGELAVPTLTREAKRGLVWAVDGLAAVGTPTAVQALGEVVLPEWLQPAELRSGRRAGYRDVGYRASWHLAAQFDDPGVQDALRALPFFVPKPSDYRWHLTAQLDDPHVQDALRAVPSVPAHPDWRWVWEPFWSAHDGELPAVASKVVFLLALPGAARHRPEPVEPVAAELAIPAAISLEDMQLPSPSADSPLHMLQLGTPAEWADRVADRFGTQAVHQAADRAIDDLPPEPSTFALRSILEGAAPGLRSWVVRALERPVQERKRLWRDLYRGPSAPYDFDRSWHYRTVLGICLLVSAVALGRTVGTVTGMWPWGPSWLAWVGGSAISFAWGMGVVANVLNVSETLTDGLSAPWMLLKAVWERDFAEVVLRILPTAGLVAITTYAFVTLWDLLTLAGAIAAVVGLFAIAGGIVLLALQRVRLWENPLRMALDAAKAARASSSVLADRPSRH